MNRSRLLVLPLAALVLFLASAPAEAVYHPTLGRFLQRDPIGYADGMSLYEYVWSRPTHATDPLGFSGLTLTGEPARAAAQSRLRRRIESRGNKPITDSAGNIIGERRCQNINCLGDASGEGDFIQPFNERDSEGNFLTETTFKDFMEAGGWNCRPMKEGDQCTCKPREERLILIFYTNTATRPDGSPIDPYNDPWPGPAAGPESRLPEGHWARKGADFHAVKGPPGAQSGNWSEVMGNQEKRKFNLDGNQSPNPAAKPKDMTAEEAHSKFEDTPRYCCCRCNPSSWGGSGSSGP